MSSFGNLSDAEKRRVREYFMPNYTPEVQAIIEKVDAAMLAVNKHGEDGGLKFIVPQHDFTIPATLWDEFYDKLAPTAKIEKVAETRQHVYWRGVCCIRGDA